MSALDRADRMRSVLERMHRPDATLSATRRRRDFITRPQESHRMTDRLTIEPLLELLELIPSAGRLRTLAAIAEAGELGALGVHEAGAAPTLGMAAYHVRCLVKAELVELVRQEPRRGAVASFYALSPAGSRFLQRIERVADELAEALA